MEDKTKIRIAQKMDIPQLVSLLEILFTQEADFKPDNDKQQKGLEMIIDNPDYGKNGHILVAIMGGKIVGTVNLIYTSSTVEGAQVVTLEDMIINPGYRSFGIGTALLKHAIEFCKSQGHKRITLLTDHDNERAIHIYTKLGFTKSNMIPLRLKL
ncbi:MAG TPA: GNAT family N-acetyltransferase [Parafilimonas sp.]|nr:GNAT family N-acetyltransferase [Parafilimonas sp.]